MGKINRSIKTKSATEPALLVTQTVSNISINANINYEETIEVGSKKLPSVSKTTPIQINIPIPSQDELEKALDKYPWLLSIVSAAQDDVSKPYAE